MSRAPGRQAGGSSGGGARGGRGRSSGRGGAGAALDEGAAALKVLAESLRLSSEDDVDRAVELLRSPAVDRGLSRLAAQGSADVLDPIAAALAQGGPGAAGAASAVTMAATGGAAGAAAGIVEHPGLLASLLALLREPRPTLAGSRAGSALANVITRGGPAAARRVAGQEGALEALLDAVGGWGRGGRYGVERAANAAASLIHLATADPALAARLAAAPGAADVFLGAKITSSAPMRATLSASYSA